MKTEIKALCIGQPQPFNGAELSAIGKYPVSGPITVHDIGLEGDMVADTKSHGGPDMAVHQYPLDHYGWWNEKLGGHALLQRPAAFGENIVAQGITEQDVHIGDQFRFGTAVLEVSQPRQPCWKIEHRFARKGMVRAIIQTHRCGWYYRILEEGIVKAGDMIERIETGHGEWSVARLFAKLYDPSNKASRGELAEIAELDKLCVRWRSKVRDALSN